MLSKILQLINWKTLLYFSPLIIVVSYYFFDSLVFNLHDFSNSYFPARLIQDNIPYSYLFDIYEFNSYIWSLGYTDVLGDFYLNSPFTITVFYPLSFIENAHLAKAIFNFISIFLFIWSVYILIRKKLNGEYAIVLILPFIFLIPIKNQILFGQSYFLIFSLVILGFLFIEDKREKIGAGLLSFSVLLKVFPVFYGVSLFFYKSRKSILIGVITIIILMLGSIYISGFQLWKTYFTEILPNAIQNNSMVDFRYNTQSFDVFLKTLFIDDPYYNPTALFNSNRMYVFLNWLFKSVIIAAAISVSFKHKNNLFNLLSIWIVTLFLLQNRTATYAQILWMIPAICFLNQKTGTTKKIFFLAVLFIVCNIPISQLEFFPIIFKFSRIWFTILLSILFFKNFSVKLNIKWLITVFIVLSPLHLDVFKENKKINSAYVLAKKEYFLIYDFFENKGNLYIKALGKNGDQIVNTHIPISSFKENISEIKGNQIVLNKKVLIDDYSLKKKPVLVNNKEVYYLTDHHSRRGAYTLKKVSIEKIP